MTGNGNLETHQATYGKVIGLIKWGAIACFVIAFVVVWLIAG